jgi:hypothetical protein
MASITPMGGPARAVRDPIVAARRELREAIEANLRESTPERRAECSRLLTVYRQAFDAQMATQAFSQRVEDELRAAIYPAAPSEMGPRPPSRAGLVYALGAGVLFALGALLAELLK